MKNRYTNDAKHLFIMRSMSITIIALVIANLVAYTLLYYFFPLKEIKPFFLTLYPSSEQTVVIETKEITADARIIMSEHIVKQYVKIRETINDQTFAIRSKEMEIYSTAELHYLYMSNVNLEKPSSPLIKFHKKNISRSISIKNISLADSMVKKLYEVEWVATDYDNQNNASLREQKYTSLVTFDYLPSKMSKDNVIKNPVGIKIIEYSVVKK